MANTERTFVMVKPDGVRRGLVGEVIRRFEAKGLRIVALKQHVPSRELAERHYAVHRDKPFFSDVVAFITSGPVVAMVLEGPEGTIEMARLVMGKTRPTEAAPGTIRGDYANTTQENLVHGSDAPETAGQEIGLWFGADELAA
jgi:nucleoside-diphosphate kinase